MLRNSACFNWDCGADLLALAAATTDLPSRITSRPARAREDGDTVEFVWKPPTSTGGVPLAGYRVQVSTALMVVRARFLSVAFFQLSRCCFAPSPPPPPSFRPSTRLPAGGSPAVLRGPVTAACPPTCARPFPRPRPCHSGQVCGRGRRVVRDPIICTATCSRTARTHLHSSIISETTRTHNARKCALGAIIQAIPATASAATCRPAINRHLRARARVLRNGSELGTRRDIPSDATSSARLPAYFTNAAFWSSAPTSHPPPLSFSLLVDFTNPARHQAAMAPLGMPSASLRLRLFLAFRAASPPLPGHCRLFRLLPAAARLYLPRAPASQPRGMRQPPRPCTFLRACPTRLRTVAVGAASWTTMVERAGGRPAQRRRATKRLS